MRAFDIGDKVICNRSCVVGRVIRFYKPTACEEQTLVYLEDGRRYHAPTSEWVKYKDGLKPSLMICDEVAFSGCNSNSTQAVKNALNAKYGINMYVTISDSAWSVEKENPNLNTKPVLIDLDHVRTPILDICRENNVIFMVGGNYDKCK
jgi:hypothetical protein